MTVGKAALPTVAFFRTQLFKPSEAFITEQAQALRCHEPVMLGRELHGPAPSQLQWEVPEAWSRLTRTRFTLTSGPDPFCAYLRQRRTRLIHAHFGPDALIIQSLARRLGIPLITTLHGFDVAVSKVSLLLSGKPALLRYALGYRRLARGGDLFLCVSDVVRRRVLEQGFPDSRVVRHYIGTHTEQYAGPYPERDRGPPIVLHVARLVEKKGTEYLLRAWALVHPATADARLIIIGDGPLHARLQALAMQLGIAGRVSFLGSQPHAVVRGWLRKSSLFALPSVTARNGDSEGLPISIIEAAAAALPILATLHSGIPEAVEHERGGLLVRERDVAGLGDALRTLLGNSALRERMGTTAQDFVRRHFDIRTQSAGLEALYGKVA